MGIMSSLTPKPLFARFFCQTHFTSCLLWGYNHYNRDNMRHYLFWITIPDEKLYPTDHLLNYLTTNRPHVFFLSFCYTRTTSSTVYHHAQHFTFSPSTFIILFNTQKENPWQNLQLFYTPAGYFVLFRSFIISILFRFSSYFDKPVPFNGFVSCRW